MQDNPESLQSGAAVTWSCVLDDTPALWRHFFIWIAALTECAAVRPESILVHHAAELRADIRALLARLQIRTQPVQPFDKRSPHSNKIRQCSSDFSGSGRVVLTDVDVAFVSRPPVERIAAPVAGKPVDSLNPPVEVLCEVFRRANLQIPDEKVTVTRDDRTGRIVTFQTFPAHYNGGFYVIDRAVLAEFGEAWAYWARWLLDGSHIPAPYTIHVDQIAFCMAVHSLALESETLHSHWNLPSHVPTPLDDAAPYLVHHHGSHDERLQLLPLKPARHEAAIAKTNARIADFLKRHEITSIVV
jgi:hypothetical protein